MTDTSSHATPLPARQAYRLWAGQYDEETVISALEDRVVSRLSPRPAGRTLLDAGCGTGRRVARVAGEARRAVGVDLVPEMLKAGREAGVAGPVASHDSQDAPGPARSDGWAGAQLAAGDLHALPFGPDLFDLVWCRLVLGHVADAAPVYSELARVSRTGADLVITDFHPAAAAAGHVRSFRDAGGVLHTIVHHPHSETDQRAAAEAAGWTVTGVHNLTPGDEERLFYERAGRLGDYEAHRDLPLVLALCLTR